MSKPAVLLIHGFTSHRSSLEALIPELKANGFAWHYPILAGHGTSPEDLEDKRWHHWQADIERAHQYLRQSNDKIVVVAISMGTLLAMELAANYPEDIAGLVLLSPCLRFKDKLSLFTPVMRFFVTRHPFGPKKKYAHASQEYLDKGYQWFPTASYYSYWKRTRTILPVIANVRCPVRIIQSKADHIADPRGAQKIFDLLQSPKEILWHEQSGHELLLDLEVKKVIEEIMNFAPLRGPRGG